MATKVARTAPSSSIFCFLFLVSVLQICLCVDLTYYVEEGKNPGTFVGDIAVDSHLLNSVSMQHRSLIRFLQLEQNTTGASKMFRVAKKTGRLYTTQTLDAETLCTYNTECFRMVDVAVRQETSFIKILEIKVVLQDVNDHQPEFKTTEVSLEFSENDSKGIRKLIPNAVDKDIGVLNSQITYQLKRNLNEPFTLSVAKSVDGTADLSITLEERLDRELQDAYRLQVIAKDGGVPQKQSVLDVHISVVDINDNTPVFSQNIYNVSANNELLGAMPVVILSATDLDSGKNGKVSYHFSSKTSRTALDHFDINSETGEIFLQKKFTSRQKMTYKLYVKATDGGIPPLSSVTMVQVNVINQQNNAPTIDVNFVSASDKNTATISEDIEVGSFIAYVKVTDVDMGQNGDVICDLHHDKFQLRSLGPKKYKVTVKSPVDRETDDHHDITINCQDRGSPPLHCESRFSIRVTDVNDAKPEFSKETFKFWTNENEKPKMPIGFINATDPDLGLGGKLTYSLLTNSKHFLPFQISDEGLVSTVVSLDREFQEIYKFQVFVKDNGAPSLSNTVNVIVEVKDVNDNAPYFIFPNVNPFTLDVLYYPHLTNNITVLKASDSDSRENAFLKYEITAGNDKLLFMLNHYSGFLTFTREVTPQDSGSYELEFVVRDSGTPALSATTTLILVLTVSNKTSEMMNVVHIQRGNKIHLNLVIIVTLTAVVLSVVITASVSLCILRCNNQLNVPHRVGVNSSKKCVNEQRHLMCPSYLQTSWNDVPLTITTDSDLRSSLSTKSRRGQHCGEDLSEKEKCASLGAGTNLQSSSDVLHQTCVRDVAEPFGVDGDIKSPVMAPDFHSGVSTAYSYADSGHAWSEADTRHGEELSDVQFSNFCMPSTPRRFFSCNNPTSSTQTFGYSNDPLTEGGGGGVGGSLYQSKTSQNTFQADANYFQIAATDNDISDGTHAQPRNQPEKVCHPSPPRPLPPVPHLGRARPNSQHFQNQQQQSNVDQPPSQEPYPVKPMQISQTGLKYGHQAVKSTAL